MRLSVSKTYRKYLSQHKILYVTVCPCNWTSIVKMELREEGDPQATAVLEKSHMNYDRLLPLKVARKLGAYHINKQAYEIAGIQLIP